MTERSIHKHHGNITRKPTCLIIPSHDNEKRPVLSSGRICGEWLRCMTIPFPAPESAALAYNVLIVDKEHKRSEVRREFATEGENLVVTFYGTDPKRLRVAVNGTLKNISLIARTIDMFQSR